MQAALAEMNIDDLTHDAEEDVDFVIKGMFLLGNYIIDTCKHAYDIQLTRKMRLNPISQVLKRRKEQMKRLAKKLWKKRNV